MWFLFIMLGYILGRLDQLYGREFGYKFGRWLSAKILNKGKAK